MKTKVKLPFIISYFTISCHHIACFVWPPLQNLSIFSLPSHKTVFSKLSLLPLTVNYFFLVTPYLRCQSYNLLQRFSVVAVYMSAIWQSLGSFEIVMENYSAVRSPVAQHRTVQSLCSGEAIPVSLFDPLNIKSFQRWGSTFKCFFLFSLFCKWNIQLFYSDKWKCVDFSWLGFQPSPFSIRCYQTPNCTLSLTHLCKLSNSGGFSLNYANLSEHFDCITHFSQYDVLSWRKTFLYIMYW